MTPKLQMRLDTFYYLKLKSQYLAQSTQNKEKSYSGKKYLYYIRQRAAFLNVNQ